MAGFQSLTALARAMDSPLFTVAKDLGKDGKWKWQLVTEWPPKFRAWLTDKGELRTTGVCDDLAGEIKTLTVRIIVKI